MQAERQPEYPLLYSLQGFLYGELLLAEVERAARRGPAAGKDSGLRQVAQRGGSDLAWAEINQASLLSISPSTS